MQEGRAREDECSGEKLGKRVKGLSIRNVVSNTGRPVPPLRDLELGLG